MKRVRGEAAQPGPGGQSSVTSVACTSNGECVVLAPVGDTRDAARHLCGQPRVLSAVAQCEECYVMCTQRTKATLHGEGLTPAYTQYSCIQTYISHIRSGCQPLRVVLASRRRILTHHQLSIALERAWRRAFSHRVCSCPTWFESSNHAMPSPRCARCPEKSLLGHSTLPATFMFKAQQRVVT